jgi:PEP-CTERM motif-containing protein
MRKKSILTGLAGAAALAGASQAYGTIVVRPLPANIVGHDPASTTSGAQTNRNIDVDGNGTTDLRITYRSFTSGAYQLQQMFTFANTGQTAAYGPVGANSQYYAYDLQMGEAIPGTNPFGQNPMFLTQVVTNVNGSDYAIWMTGERAFIGFSFMNAASQLNYGYIEVEMDAFQSAANPGGVKFFSLAYENSGGSINAGAVPEPSTLAALAFGAVGLGAAALRRRKKS